MFTETHDATPSLATDAGAGRAKSGVPVAPATLDEGEPGVGKPRIMEEVIIEEVSIDGMCGVY
jgi:mycofactocin precursor